ncbi:hypothetical protein TgHK011_002269 [Trichoderma gracile]|nr:hypothetical protein TgHK011_002269 [Trichoderma gracile]
MASKKSYGDYSVGWICALPKEQTAATAMLDERHADLPKLTNDANTYTLGSIGPHNVVIACLPKGQYGTMGGVPPKVRLGDVVISTPTGQYPGVVQWDFGKETQGGGFERTGALSNPPGSLLTALAKLETKYELTGSKIPECLEELKARFPRLAKKYLKSDKLQDLLFQSDYVHIKEPFSNMNSEGPTGGMVEVSVEEDFEDGSDEDGDPCQFCDKSRVIKRKRRSIRVHHGLIASGNKVIKNGLLREKLNSALGGEILCFETEAAGLMNNFPCLVIRGICDYCDSHKNDAWQEHAAAVAAAFAKELLGCIQPSDFEGERLLGDIMSELKQGVQRLYDASVETKKHLDTFRDDNEAKKQIEALNWLSPLDFPLIQHDYFARCEPGTGQEFLLSEQVQSWISTSKETMFCEGVPGAGKTFQMAILVNYLTEKFRYDGTVGVAYIYYNYKRHHDQKAEHMLASLVKQLAQNSRIFPEAVQRLHDRHRLVNTRPFLVELSDTLAILVRSFSRVFILIDALDEAEDSERTKLLDCIFMIQEESGLNLFATSRAINTIAAKFEGTISREISPSRHDVFQFLNARMCELPSFVREDEDLQNEIKASIEAAMGGMFLLAQLYLNSFVGSRSPSSLKKSLKSLQEASSSSSSSPSSDRSSVLDEAYDKSMERIQQLKGDLPRDAILIISWIVKAKRQMKVAELQEALAVEIGASELDKDNIPTVDHIIQACASLVVVEGDGIELVHYTAQEYFERPDNRWMQEAHTYITRVCLTYLSFSDFRVAPFMSREDRAKRIKDRPFYGYSDENWACHSDDALEQGFEVSRVVEFLDYGATQPSWCWNLMCGHLPAPLDPEYFSHQVTPLHIAAFFGLYEVVVNLLSQGFSPNGEDSTAPLALSWAAMGGNARVVRFLLEVTNVGMANDVRYENCMPLLIAAFSGHQAAVEVLLERYPIESSEGNDGWTALHAAVYMERQAVFDLLVEKGADIEARLHESHLTPLARCAKDGRTVAVQWLLERGADIEARDDKKRTPLMLATIGNHENIVQYLLGKGADDKAEDINNLTPSLVAMMRKNDNLDRNFIKARGNISVADSTNQALFEMALREKLNGATDFFLRNGFDINMTMEDECTSLTRAIVNGADDVVEWLVEKGADLDKEDGHDKTPLLKAIEKGNKHVVHFLIDKGARLEYRVPEGYSPGPTPLVFAAGEGRKEMVELLLDRGADLEARAGYWAGTALIEASKFGHTEVIQLLLQRGADIEAKNRINDTALIEASIFGQTYAIKLFLINNADIEAKAWSGRTALGRAALANKPGAVRILLDNGANVEAEDDYRDPPIVLAVQEGSDSIVKMLLDSDSKTDYRDSLGQTLMHIAAGKNKLECVCVLLAHGTVEVDGKDNKGRTPLSHVAERGDGSVLKALLESEQMDVNTNDVQGHTPLRYAMERPDGDEILNILLNSEKVAVNARDGQGRIPLLYAIQRKKASLVRTLLDCERVDGNNQGGLGRAPIHYAIDHKDEDGSILRALLDSDKVDVSARDNQGRTPLHYAIEREQVSLLEMLLDCERVDVNEKNDQSLTPLRLAMDHKGQDASVLKALLSSRRVDVNATDDLGYTPLFYAIQRRDGLAIDTLLESDQVDFNAMDDQRRTPLFFAISQGCLLQLTRPAESGKTNVNASFEFGLDLFVEALIRRQAPILGKLLKSGKVDLNTRDDENRTPLHYATHLGCNLVVEVLLEHANAEEANEKDDHGRTPFQLAIELGEMATIKTFLQCGKVDANARDSQGRTPLLCAIQSVDEPTVQVLLESVKVDVNMGDNQGRTPLSYAVELRGEYIVQALLKHPDIDPNIIDDEGRTPLSCAIQSVDEHTMRLLLDCRKVNVNIADKRGRTPLSYAMELMDKYTVRSILKYDDIEVDTKDGEGRTPLSYAASHEVARALLKTGKVDVNSKDNQGRTPLWYAMRAGNQELEGLLRRRGAQDASETRSKRPSTQRSQPKGSTYRRRER